MPVSGITDDIQPTQGHGKWVKRVLVSEQGGGILGRETACVSYKAQRSRHSIQHGITGLEETFKYHLA